VVEIDDAGSGSLIGGTGIGILKKDTGEYIFDIIPLDCFKHPYFSEKRYQDYVIYIVNMAFQKLAVSKDEPVHICRGYIFDGLRNWFSEEGYSWKSVKIEGILQQKVEESFNNYVIDLGLPKNFIVHARYAFGFHRLFKWVIADYENRAALCKTGWKSWNKWVNVKIKSYADRSPRSEYCLKCGNIIEKNDEIIIMEYETNRRWFLHLHTQCPGIPPVLSDS
jgi:hypothetical protein